MALKKEKTIASVRFKIVFKQSGDSLTLDNLNIEIEENEFPIFFGPSGCSGMTSLRLPVDLEEIQEVEI